MGSDAGLSLDERIRRALTPLNGPLRIDNFLVIVQRERAARAQRDAMEARKAQAAAQAAASAAAAERRARALAAGAATASTDPSGEAPPAEPGPDLNDSARLKAEVQAFLRRDEVEGTDSNEVAGFMEFIGNNALAPEDPDSR